MPLEVVFPDLGHDPGHDGPGEEASSPADVDAVLADAVPDVGHDTTPGDEATESLDEGRPDDSPVWDDAASVGDPGVDGLDVTLCAPGDQDCPCASDADCDPSYGDLCGQNRCNKALGVCMIAPVQKDGTLCDDQDPCTLDDACLKGVCAGRPDPCDDQNPCTADHCEPGVGCRHDPQDAPCEDGDFCQGPDSCLGGACVSGPPVSCDDKNPCTEDTCEAASGCVHMPRPGPCDDGNACTVGDQCESGECLPTGPRDCNDHEPCTSDACDPAAGCRNDPVEGGCDDGDPCTQGDFCQDGACQPGPVKQCSVCGDHACDAPSEDCKTCPQDCGECPPDCVPDAMVGCGATLGGTTAGGTNAMETYFTLACISLGAKSGPERVIPFATDDKVHASVTVTGGGVLAGFDVYVLTENCVPGSCVAQGIGLFGVPAEALFDPEPGRTYFLTVDGSSQSGASFTLKTQCFEAACGDGVDNDQDGVTDCEDVDCGGSAVACGSSVAAKVGRFSHAGAYGAACGNLAGKDDDAVFRLSVAAAGTVRVTVTPDDPGDDLDLFILGGGCTGAACVAYAASASSSETVAFQAQPGTYYVVVEEAYATSESNGAFRIDVQCP